MLRGAEIRVRQEEFAIVQIRHPQFSCGNFLLRIVDAEKLDGNGVENVREARRNVRDGTGR